jgi:serralysin
MTTVAHTPSAFEQLMLELLNRARLDPGGEFDALIADASTGTAVQDNITSALTYFGVDLVSFQAQLAGLSPVAPLAWHDALAAAADAHSQLMITYDEQSHQLAGEDSLAIRIVTAGYDDWRAVSENVFAYTEDAVYGHAGFFIDWGYDDEDFSGSTLVADWQSVGDGIQDPAGHRINMLSSALTEVGISAIAEADPTTGVGPYVVTQDFGNRFDYAAQLLGVVIEDADGDRFYDMGEGLGGVTVTATGSAGTFTTTAWGAGGYQMDLPEGSYTVTFSGGALIGTATYSVTMGTENTKLDGFSADAVVLADLVGGAYDDLLQGTAGVHQALAGMAGNDTLIGGGGAVDTLMGGSGNDRLLAESTDDAFDAIAGQVYRLFQATLDRAPNMSGHAYWSEQIDSGSKTLLEVVSGFVDSQEFRNNYGDTTNEEFVTLLYNNVLDREPGAQGLQYWTTALENESLTREQVVLGFSESLELRLNTATAELAYSREGHKAAWTDDVYRLYQATLDRDPAMAGLDDWTERLADGADFLTVAAGFVGSREFQNSYGDTTNEEFVTLLFNNVLDREPGAQGLRAWTAALDDGSLSRTEVVEGFVQSREFITSSADGLESFMRGNPDDDLNGGAGNDVLFGGFGADSFDFLAADSGQNSVAALEAWDTVDLSSFGYASDDEARSHMSQQGPDVVFDDQGVRIIFEDTALSLLDDDVILT